MRHTTVFIRMAMAGTGLWLMLTPPALAQIEPEGFLPPSKPTIALTPALPEPPQQRAAWTAPDMTIPAKLVQAADWLFAIGLADPRGCEYREIEVLARDVWGQEQKIKTHGWVLPTKEGDERRFAVCWTGLVYPALSVGAAANLSADMRAIVAFRKTRDSDTTAIPPAGRSRDTEFAILAHVNESRLELALLLRLGEVELAEAYWNAFADKDADRFLEWARVWAWYIYDRAITARMLGDHGLALAMSQQLVDVRPRIEAAAAERGYEKRSIDGVEQPFLFFLSDYRTTADPVQALLADSKRRVAAEKSPPLADVLAIADQTKRVAALVRLLEEVDERQMGQPGGVALNFSRIVLAFQKEGEAAVEPLITSIESDDRLTRSVSFGRDFGSDRHLIPVYEAAYWALVGVLHNNQFGPATTHGVGARNRAEATAEVRAYAKRIKGRTLAEQWYDTLADDNAHAWQWRDAALRIVQPADRAVNGYHVELPTFPPGPRPKLHGDELRTKNPSVAALLAKRIPQMTMTQQLSSETLFRAGDAAQMALALALWEPESARPVLRQLIDRCHELLKIMSDGNSAETVSRSVSLLIAKLVELGEPESLREYCQWAVGQRPSWNVPETIFTPLWQHPDDPHVIAAVTAMFVVDDAPWRCLPVANYIVSDQRDAIVTSPLVGMPVFREHLLVNLADKKRIGVIRVDAKYQNYTWDKQSGQGSSMLRNTADPWLPNPNEERVIRICDWYALQVSKLAGAPRFELYWTSQNRDIALEGMRKFLREQGDQFRKPAK